MIAENGSRNVLPTVDDSGMTTDVASPRLPLFLQSRIGGLPRAFWALWTGAFVNRLGTMVAPFLAFYLTGVRGLSVGATGAVLALFGLGSIFAHVIGGVLTDRVGRRAT